jgi:hypothetical protein
VFYAIEQIVQMGLQEKKPGKIFCKKEFAQEVVPTMCSATSQLQQNQHV